MKSRKFILASVFVEFCAVLSMIFINVYLAFFLFMLCAALGGLAGAYSMFEPADIPTPEEIDEILQMINEKKNAHPDK